MKQEDPLNNFNDKTNYKLSKNVLLSFNGDSYDYKILGFILEFISDYKSWKNLKVFSDDIIKNEYDSVNKSKKFTVDKWKFTSSFISLFPKAEYICHLDTFKHNPSNLKKKPLNTFKNFSYLRAILNGNFETEDYPMEFDKYIRKNRWI